MLKVSCCINNYMGILTTVIFKQKKTKRKKQANYWMKKESIYWLRPYLKGMTFLQEQEKTSEIHSSMLPSCIQGCAIEINKV